MGKSELPQMSGGRKEAKRAADELITDVGDECRMAGPRIYSSKNLLNGRPPKRAQKSRIAPSSGAQGPLEIACYVEGYPST